MARRPLSGFASGTQHTAAGWLLLTVAVAVSVMVTGAVGIFFGYYPARKASRLEPIDAIRHT